MKDGRGIFWPIPDFHFSFKTTSNSSVLVPIGSALRSVADIIRKKSHAYLMHMEATVEKSIQHPVDTMIANEPWLLFSVCFSAITSVSLYLSSKSTAANELVFDRACLILWVSCSLIVFLSVAYTNTPGLGAVWLSAYLTEMILSVENMLAYHAVFSLHRVHSPDRPKGLYWGIGLAMFIRFVFLLVGGAIVAGSSLVRVTVGGVLLCVGLLSISSLMDSSHQRRARAFQIASSVCSVAEKLMPRSWWERLTPKENNSLEESAPVLLAGQSKWALGIPIFVTVLSVELCDSFLTMWNSFSVVAQTSSLFITYSSTAFALMTVRSLYLVMASQSIAVEPRLKHTNAASGLVMLSVGSQLLLSYATFGPEPPMLWSGIICAVGLGLASLNVASWIREH